MKKSIPVKVGDVIIGGNAPIAIQSMTNTKTEDVEATFVQIGELVDAGAELVRVSVMDLKDASAIPEIKSLMTDTYPHVPLIGDFHYSGHRLLREVSACAKSLDKYRINPGNVGKGKTRSSNFEEMIRFALQYQKPVRIGVNSGSLDDELLAELMEKNSNQKKRRSEQELFREAMVESALRSCAFAEKIGLGKDRIIVSLKTSNVADTVACYQAFRRRSNIALHLGITESGSGDQGIVFSSAALCLLLHEGIGDTIRVSITPRKNESRTKEVDIAKLILQSLGIRQFSPLVTSCPGCGRTDSLVYLDLAEKVNHHIRLKMSAWKTEYPGVENLKIAIMGCVVNGPGESKHADIGISLPGVQEPSSAPVFIDGKLFQTLSGGDLPKKFLILLEDYVRRRFGQKDS